jgi:hypothetical protein
VRTIIAGSRGIWQYELVEKAVVNSGFLVSVVISGTANGVDKLGEKYAIDHAIPLERYPADWDAYGKSAGYRRNQQMAEVADALIAVTNGSKGTQHMIDIATAGGLKVYVLDVRK